MDFTFHSDRPLNYVRLFAEGFTDKWRSGPRQNSNFVCLQQMQANYLLNEEGFLLLNDVYIMLGFKLFGGTQYAGWILGDTVDFGIFNNIRSGKRFAFGDGKSIMLDFNAHPDIFHYIEG